MKNVKNVKNVKNALTKTVQRVLSTISNRHVAVVHFDLLAKCAGLLIRDRKVRDAVWDFLVEWDKSVSCMPAGCDRECQEELVRFAKGQMKAWRWWFIKSRIEKTGSTTEKKKLTRQLWQSRLAFSKRRQYESTP